jgi:hypothetical protein
MKKITKIITASLLSMFLIVSNTQTFAQPGGVPEDPSLNGTNGAVGHPVNGGANIDGGMNIFLLFALAYGTHRYYRAKRKEKELAGGATE